MKIGFFDSGLGGLVILKAVARELPQYDYEFYGDTANLPYGNKTEEEIFELTKKGIEHLFNKDCLIVVIACNTASAETLRNLQDNFLAENYAGRRILGVIIPTVEEVIESGIKNVLMIATKRTVESNKYDRELAKFENSPKIISIATPALVPIIEMGDIEAALEEAKNVISKVGEVEGVILGCTHYSVLESKLTPYLAGQKIRVFSQDKIIPSKLRTYLENHPEFENRLSQEGKRNIFLTDNSTRYDSVIQELLGSSLIGD
jgi:glutamate racemase